jgi:hypothetical protein
MVASSDFRALWHKGFKHVSFSLRSLMEIDGCILDKDLPKNTPIRYFAKKTLSIV